MLIQVTGHPAHRVAKESRFEVFYVLGELEDIFEILLAKVSGLITKGNVEKTVLPLGTIAIGVQ